MMTHACPDADGVLRAFTQGEIVGDVPAGALVETSCIPIGGVAAGYELEVAEDVEADGYFFVGLVGNQLGKRGDRQGQRDECKENFFHIGW